MVKFLITVSKGLSFILFNLFLFQSIPATQNVFSKQALDIFPRIGYCSGKEIGSVYCVQDGLRRRASKVKFIKSEQSQKDT